ncbi:MAG: succinylglutamate desuccinylase/aspartoacylase family protein [Paracoccaceae bacterium]
METGKATLVADGFTLGTQSVAAGTRARVELAVSNLPDHTPVSLSVEVLHGAHPGPTMFVSAAIHGDEIVGVEIVRRLLAALDPAQMAGTLLAIPVVNSFGFLARSRYLPDRRDLNRCFPGTPAGSLGSRLAHIFLNDVVKRCDFGVDLHSAAIHRTNLPQTRVAPGNRAALHMARAFAAPVIVQSGLRERSLRAEAQDLGIPVLLYEAGEGLRFDEIAVRAGVAGILRVMADRDMIDPDSVSAPETEPHLCRESSWLRAPVGGLLRTFRAEGETVAEGDLLAVVADPTGETEVELLAPADGILIGRAVLPVVMEGDAVFHLAQEDPEADEDAVDQLTEQLSADPMFDEDEII